ncbi:MAG TPA: histidine kinase dimerization/phospho-acceptor domain-containing protein, partial [Pirellulales bacterium]|nr:histidine kinase dimerization/phospho-acceptor domain-containing protein [Pirellulales bacterium]
MNRPWQVWSLFAVCLMLVAAGLGWLTLKAIQLERQERLLTVRADFEGDVRLALRRMDHELADTFAQESTWPYFAYQSFYLPETAVSNPPDTDPFGEPDVGSEQSQTAGQSGGKGKGKAAAAQQIPHPTTVPVASPLLLPGNDFVKLYFQVDASNKAISPNCPPTDQRQLAIASGMTPDLIRQYESRLDDFQAICDNNDLAALIPNVPAISSRQTAVSVAMADQQLNDPQAMDQQATDQQATDQQAFVNDAPQQEFTQQQKPSAANDEQQDAPAQRDSDASRYAQSISPSDQLRRGNVEFQTRKRQLDKYVTNWNSVISQREQLLNSPAFGNDNKAFMKGSSASAVVEGASRAIWIGNELVLARQLSIDGRSVIQGTWLDWEKIKSHLALEVADLLRDVRIAPVFNGQSADLSRMLATLPAQLVVSAPTLADTFERDSLSPIHVSLIAAWTCLALAAVAVVVLLAGVLSLSERRGAFVSAVTHELRTPLTTFRMYAEMLAEGMIPDESRRQQYLDTLKTEADRLFHLIENVLSYARLEHGKRAAAWTRVSVAELLHGMERPLRERAQQGDMELLVDVQEQAAGCQVKT